MGLSQRACTVHRRKCNARLAGFIVLEGNQQGCFVRALPSVYPLLVFSLSSVSQGRQVPF